VAAGATGALPPLAAMTTSLADPLQPIVVLAS
jgi:hypothetical protein